MTKTIKMFESKELWRITLSWRDVLSAKHPTQHSAEVLPRKRYTTYVAVDGSFGTEMLSAASSIAVRAIVGNGPAEEWQPLIEAAEYLGTVYMNGNKEELDYSPQGMDDAAIFRKRSVRKRVRGMLKGGAATISQDGRFARVQLRDKEGKEMVSCWATPPGCGGDVEINSIPADLTYITTRGSDYPSVASGNRGGWKSGQKDACDRKDQTHQRGE